MRESNTLMDRFMGLGARNIIGWDQEDKGLTRWGDGFRAPLWDIRETEKNIIADIEVPGADKKDIKLNVTEDEIEVKAEKRKEKKTNEEGGYSYESRSSSYYRKIPLPVEIKADKVKARYRNGILNIEAPKADNNIKNKKSIDIE